MNQKLQSRQIDAKELKSITPDTISKKALVHDDNFLDSLLKKVDECDEKKDNIFSNEKHFLYSRPTLQLRND